MTQFWKTFFSTRSLLIAILVLAAAIRLMYFFLVFDYSSPPANDSLEHHLIARNLVAGQGYELYGQPTAFRAPLLTFLVAGIYRILESNYILARLLVILFSILLVWVIYELGRTAVSPGVGLWSALIAALWIHFVLYSARIFTEIPYTLFSVLTIVLLMKHLQNSRLIYLILAAVSMALAILTRPVGMFFLMLIILLLVIQERKVKSLTRLLWFGGITLLLLAPWIWRNYQVFHRVVPVTTAGGLVLWISNNHYVAHHPEIWGRYVGFEQLPGARNLIPPDEIARNGFAITYTGEFLKKHPGDIPRLLWNKTRRFWSPEVFTYSPRGRIVELVYIGLLLLAIPGILWAYRKNPGGNRWLWVIIVANFLPALVYWSGSRIRLPAEPALIVFAAISLNSVWNTIREKLS